MQKLKHLLKKWYWHVLYQIGRICVWLIALSALSVLVFRWLPLPTTSFVFQDTVRSWTTNKPKDVYYHWVGYSRISPSLALAVIASEDQRFVEHAGFDLQAIQSAVVDRIHGGRVRGASTISQQVAKNIFLWRGQSFLRKGVEAYFTLLIETFWTKQRILEVYLNAAEFGPGIYGVGAASRIYFQKNPDQIGAQEAALMAAVLPNPKRLRVMAPSSYVRSRQLHILRQMRLLGASKYMKML